MVKKIYVMCSFDDILEVCWEKDLEGVRRGWKVRMSCWLSVLPNESQVPLCHFWNCPKTLCWPPRCPIILTSGQGGKPPRHSEVFHNFHNLWKTQNLKKTKKWLFEKFEKLRKLRKSFFCLFEISYPFITYKHTQSWTKSTKILIVVLLIVLI